MLRSVSICVALATGLLGTALMGSAGAEVPPDIRDSLAGHGHALLIGVTKYQDSAWPELRSVKDDIDDLAKGFAPHFATVETLVDPTADALGRKLRAFMTGKWNRPDERLLVYYASHGFTDYNPSSRISTG